MRREFFPGSEVTPRIPAIAIVDGAIAEQLSPSWAWVVRSAPLRSGPGCPSRRRSGAGESGVVRRRYAFVFSRLMCSRAAPTETTECARDGRCRLTLSSSLSLFRAPVISRTSSARGRNLFSFRGAE